MCSVAVCLWPGASCRGKSPCRLQAASTQQVAREGELLRPSSCRVRFREMECFRPWPSSQFVRLTWVGRVRRIRAGEWVRCKPGLASCLQSFLQGLRVGASCCPCFVDARISTREVQDDWRFVLLCSDGIWEFVSSQEAGVRRVRCASACCRCSDFSPAGPQNPGGGREASVAASRDTLFCVVAWDVWVRCLGVFLRVVLADALAGRPGS